MDLFHAVTQGIENVLACHWLEDFKAFKLPTTSTTTNNTNNTNNNKIMDKTMNTEAGGESTQYESIKTQTVPTAKQTGQLGGGLGHSGFQEGVSKERGEKTAENMRYGQAMSEQGVGGMTKSMTGEVQQGGYGGSAIADKREENPDAAQSRKAQGYGSGSGVGA